MKKTKSNLQNELKGLKLKLLMFGSDKNYVNFIQSEIRRVKEELNNLN